MARREHRTVDTDNSYDHPRIAFPVAQQDLIENTLTLKMRERDQGKSSLDCNLLSIPRTVDTDDHPRIAHRVAQRDLIENTLMKEQLWERYQSKTSRDYNLLSIPTIPEVAGGTKRGLRVEAIDDARDAEVIPPEEGVCRFCFRMLKGDDNILKTKCGCQLTLIHTECANTHWPSTAATCGVCKQDVLTIRVIIRVIIAPYSEFHSHMRKSTPAEIKYKNFEDKHNDEHLKVQKPTKKEREQSPEIKLQKPAPTSIGNAHGRRCCIL